MVQREAKQKLGRILRGIPIWRPTNVFSRNGIKGPLARRILEVPNFPLMVGSRKDPLLTAEETWVSDDSPVNSNATNGFNRGFQVVRNGFRPSTA